MHLYGFNNSTFTEISLYFQKTFSTFKPYSSNETLTLIFIHIAFINVFYTF